jgi:predicted nucleotidyltransferase
MDVADGNDGVVGDLGESLCSDPAVEFAVAFGSRVTGDDRSSSDFDVAVKFSDTLSSEERFRKRCFLSGTLQRPDGPFVDVSDIEELPLDVAHDVVAGEVLCGDEQAFQEFKSATERQFEKQRGDIRRHQREVIDRIADDGLHG